MLVAAQDLPAGHSLTATDLRARSWPADAAPEGELRSAAGQVLAGPIRAGEPLTDARVIGPGLLAGQSAGTLAMPVRLADSSVSAFIRAGDRVNVLVSAESDWSSQSGTSTQSGTSAGASAPSIGGNSAAVQVVTGALVLAAPGSGGSASEDGVNASSGSGLPSLGGGGGSLGSGIGFGGAGESGDPASGPGAGVIVLAVTSSQAAELAAAQTGRFVTVAVSQPS